MQGSLDFPPNTEERHCLADGAWLLKGFALVQAEDLLATIAEISAQAPFRHLLTPGGQRMSAAMSNCGKYGWTSDRLGYRYSETDPLSGARWPAMPESFRTLAVSAAASCGYPDFEPEACLINRYVTGARMALHQDRDEADFSAPIVSVSLGAPIRFLFGGPQRGDKPASWLLEHGDVVVWGGPSRLYFHGVAPLGQRAAHRLTGALRYNLTFRKVG